MKDLSNVWEFGENEKKSIFFPFWEHIAICNINYWIKSFYISGRIDRNMLMMEILSHKINTYALCT